MTYRQVIVLGLIVTVGCAALVWALERFEIAKLHASFRDLLERHDEFRAWEADHGKGGA